MMGATGSGKTTLINAMVNYILGVEWDDPFRFQLIDEKLKISQAHSQTEVVTAYDIHWKPGMRIDCSLTIVDTPGYSNTKGIEQDKQITESIKQFFNDRYGIQEVDVVGIVAQAPLVCLKASQVNSFDSVLSIFGRDIKDNINLLLTFSDGRPYPEVMSLVQDAKVPCLKDTNGQPVIHYFNNMELIPHSPEQIDILFNKFSWNLNMENFKRFFVKLGELKTRSLTLTKEVLGERMHLETTVQGFQKKLFKAHKLQKVKQFFEENQTQIDAKVKLQFPVEVFEGQKVDLGCEGRFATNCLRCQVTCHYPCSRQNGENLQECSAIDRICGNCHSCKKSCSWEKHRNQSYRWDYVVRTKMVFAEDVKNKYEALQNKKLTAQEFIKSLEKDAKAVESDINILVTKAVDSTRRLQQIALRPTTVYNTDYIDILIKAAEENNAPDCEQSIRFLQQLREQAKILSKIESGVRLADLKL